MKWIFSILLVGMLALGGCATTYPDCVNYEKGTPKYEECQIQVRDERRLIDIENYNNCTAVYSAELVPFWCVGHPADHRQYVPSNIRMDLTNNSCRRVLRDHWADY